MKHTYWKDNHLSTQHDNVRMPFSIIHTCRFVYICNYTWHKQFAKNSLLTKREESITASGVQIQILGNNLQGPYHEVSWFLQVALSIFGEERHNPDSLILAYALI